LHCKEQQFDVIVSDVNLIGATGPELVAELVSNQRPGGVVFMSGRLLDSVSLDQLPHPARYLQKPFHPSDLLRVVHAAASRPRT
jgi:CheY-like chemotaxis protein